MYWRPKWIRFFIFVAWLMCLFSFAQETNNDKEITEISKTDNAHILYWNKDNGLNLLMKPFIFSGVNDIEEEKITKLSSLLPQFSSNKTRNFIKMLTFEYEHSYGFISYKIYDSIRDSYFQQSSSHFQIDVLIDPNGRDNWTNDSTFILGLRIKNTSDNNAKSYQQNNDSNYLYDAIFQFKSGDIISDSIEEFQFQVKNSGMIYGWLEDRIVNSKCDISLSTYNWGSKIETYLSANFKNDTTSSKQTLTFDYNFTTFLKSYKSIYINATLMNLLFIVYIWFLCHEFYVYIQSKFSHKIFFSYIFIFVVWNMWIYEIIQHILQNSDIDGWWIIFPFVIMLTFIVAWAVILVKLLQYSLFNECQGEAVSVTIIVFGIALLFLRGFIYRFFSNFILLNESTYLFWSNVWLFNIILNIILRTRTYTNIGSRVMFSIILIVYPALNIVSEKLWTPFSMNFYFKWTAYHSIQIIFLSLQYFYGSLFFLPQKYRRRVYDKFIKKLNSSNVNRNGNVDQWPLWLNSLDETELSYSDDLPGYKWIEGSNKKFIQTPWNHKFHVNWILSHIQRTKACPICASTLPENHFDD